MESSSKIFSRWTNNEETSHSYSASLTSYWTIFHKEMFLIYKNEFKVIFSLAILLAADALLFWWKFEEWSAPDSWFKKKFDLLGYSLPIAKGTAQIMKLHFGLMLLPVARNFIAALRSSFLRYFIPFDDAISLHRFLGIGAFIAALVHSLCHVFNNHRIADPAYYVLYKKAFPKQPIQPTEAQMWQMHTSSTGIAMMLIMLIAHPFAVKFPRLSSFLKNTRIGTILNNFDYFWYTHHMFIGLYIMLLIHPWPGLPYKCVRNTVPSVTRHIICTVNTAGDDKHGDTWIWISAPLLIFIIEKLIRYFRKKFMSVRLLEAKILPGESCHTISPGEA
jgi:respiratory burst oxidase